MQFLACADHFGRILVVDTRSMTLVRLIKGQRGAQCAWLTLGRTPVLVTYLRTRGVLQLFHVYAGAAGTGKLCAINTFAHGHLFACCLGLAAPRLFLWIPEKAKAEEKSAAGDGTLTTTPAMYELRIVLNERVTLERRRRRRRRRGGRGKLKGKSKVLRKRKRGGRGAAEQAVVSKWLKQRHWKTQRARVIEEFRTRPDLYWPAILRLQPMAPCSSDVKLEQVDPDYMEQKMFCVPLVEEVLRPLIAAEEKERGQWGHRFDHVIN